MDKRAETLGLSISGRRCKSSQCQLEAEMPKSEDSNIYSFSVCTPRSCAPVMVLYLGHQPLNRHPRENTH